MSSEFLGDRKKALEESFFAKQNAAVLERMREKRERVAAIEALSRTSNIADRAILEKLVELGIDAATWAALSLVPLVEVAWADGDVKAKEREAVLAAAHEQGIESGSPSHQLLEAWLTERPASSLFASWGAYATELAANLDSHQRAALHRDLADRAHAVARAAGGILGIGAESEAERRVIEALGRPFA
jgi:uncharacterized tellurite resistance protein B-like protein